MLIGIYKIKSPSGRCYIGQSKNLLRRIKSYGKLNCKSQPKLYRSFLKWGFFSHNIEILEMFVDYNQSLMNIRERFWQEKFNAVSRGLNCFLVETNQQERMLSSETISNYSKGQLNSPNSRKGKKHSEKSKALIKKARSRQIITDAHKRNISENSKSAVQILNTETGIYYRTIKDAAFSIGIKPNYLICSLIGRNKNNSQFLRV